jgi:hypothetical protein
VGYGFNCHNHFRVSVTDRCLGLSDLGSMILNLLFTSILEVQSWTEGCGIDDIFFQSFSMQFAFGFVSLFNIVKMVLHT